MAPIYSIWTPIQARGQSQTQHSHTVEDLAMAAKETNSGSKGELVAVARESRCGFVLILVWVCAANHVGLCWLLFGLILVWVWDDFCLAWLLGGAELMMARGLCSSSLLYLLGKRGTEWWERKKNNKLLLCIATVTVNICTITVACVQITHFYIH